MSYHIILMHFLNYEHTNSFTIYCTLLFLLFPIAANELEVLPIGLTTSALKMVDSVQVLASLSHWQHLYSPHTFYVRVLALPWLFSVDPTISYAMIGRLYTMPAHYWSNYWKVLKQCQNPDISVILKIPSRTCLGKICTVFVSMTHGPVGGVAAYH